MKHQVLTTTRNGGLIIGQRTPNGATDYDGGIYYVTPERVPLFLSTHPQQRTHQ